MKFVTLLPARRMAFFAVLLVAMTASIALWLINSSRSAPLIETQTPPFVEGSYGSSNGSTVGRDVRAVDPQASFSSPTAPEIPRDQQQLIAENMKQGFLREQLRQDEDLLLRLKQRNLELKAAFDELKQAKSKIGFNRMEMQGREVSARAQMESLNKQVQQLEARIERAQGQVK